MYSRQKIKWREEDLYFQSKNSIIVPIKAGGEPPPSGEAKGWPDAMRRCRPGAHARTGLEVRLVRVPGHRKRVLTGQGAIRTRDVLRRIAIGRRPRRQDRRRPRRAPVRRPPAGAAGLEDGAGAQGGGVGPRVLPSEFARPRKRFWGRRPWARGHLAAGSGAITDAMIQHDIGEREGAPVEDDGRSSSDP